jgi:hypothetical protein
MGESRHQGSEAASPAKAPGEAAPDARGEPKDRDRVRRQEEARRPDPPLASGGDVERNMTFGGEARRKAAANNGRPVVQWEVPEVNKEGRKVAVLTPKGVLRIGVRACRDSKHTVVGQEQLGSTDWRRSGIP